MIYFGLAIIVVSSILIGVPLLMNPPNVGKSILIVSSMSQKMCNCIAFRMLDVLLNDWSCLSFSVDESVVQWNITTLNPANTVENAIVRLVLSHHSLYQTGNHCWMLLVLQPAGWVVSLSYRKRSTRRVGIYFYWAFAKILSLFLLVTNHI